MTFALPLQCNIFIMSFKVIAEAEGRLAGLDGGSREGEKEGEDMVANFLKRVQSLGSQGEEGKQKFREILKEAEASQNSYTKGLITQARTGGKVTSKE